MLKRGRDAIGGAMGLVALILGATLCFADTLELEPHWRLDRIRAGLPKDFRASRRRARLSPASGQVRASGDYRAQPTLAAFRHMPGSGRVARKRRDQGECGVQRHYQLHVRNGADQSQVRRRDRLQSDGRDVARHDLCQMPPVAAGRAFQQRVAGQSPIALHGCRAALGGEHACRDRLGKDRSPRQSRDSIASAKWASPPKAEIPGGLPNVFNRRRPAGRTVSLFKKYFADNGALIGLNVRGALPKLKNSVRSPVAARIGERQRALHNPEVLLNEPDHAAEVLRRIADRPGGRVGGHHDQRHTESHLIAALWGRFDHRGVHDRTSRPNRPK